MGLAVAGAASTASRSGLAITITGDDGPNNIRYPDLLEADVEDQSGITAAGECIQLTPTRVRCGGQAGGLTVTVALGGGDDRFSWTVNHDFLTIDGGPGNDDIDASSGPDTITGGDGNDTIVAGNANDTVDGGPGDDSIKGGGADDEITGGAGRDSINGDGEAFASNDGNDVVHAQDGEGDTVTCGFGADVVNADQVDVIDAPSCEQVNRAAGPAPAPTPGAAPPPAPVPQPALDVGLRAPSAARLGTLLRRGLRVRLTISAPCSGAVDLVVRAAEARRLGLGRAQVVIAAVRGDVAAAGILNVTLKPKARYARKLKRAKRLTAYVVLSCEGVASADVDRQKVVFRR